VTGTGSGTDASRSALDPGSLRIFICYRREDAAANAGRLADALVERYGRDSVFMDVDTIEPGVDFNEAIDRAVGQCDVLIALIGPHWLDSANMRGRRLDDPYDFVRLEIGNALDRNIRVIPALVGGAGMPEPDQLPGDLTNLAKRNAVELSDKRFRSDLLLLLEPLDRIAKQKRESVIPTAIDVAPSPVAAGIAVTATAQPPRVPPPVLPPSQSIPPIGARVQSAQPPRRNMLPLVAVVVAVALIIVGAGALALVRLGSKSLASNPTVLTALPAGYVGTWKGSAHEISPAADFAIIMTLQSGQIGSKVGHIDRPGLNCQQDLVLDKATTQSLTLTEQYGPGAYCAQSVALGTKIVASLGSATMSWKEFQADPSSGNPIATATLATASSGPIAQTTNLLAVPDGYAGTWRGSAHEISPAADFGIVMTIQSGQIGTNVGHVDRPSVNCQQDLILDKATGQSITLTEQYGPGSYCAQSVALGTKIVASLGSATMGWKEFQADPSSGNPIATATLATASAGPIPGTTDLLAVPDGYAGTWKGSAHEITPPVDFGIVMTIQSGQIGTKVGHIDRPSVNCQQDLILDKATDQSLTLTEQYGPGSYCAQSVALGIKIVIDRTGASMDWKEFQADPSAGNPIASATLGSS
jgi:hypothetical protein